MTNDGWINWPTESFNLCLVNDKERLDKFRHQLLDGELELFYLGRMAGGMLANCQEHHLIDYYEVAVNQLSYLRTEGFITDSQMNDAQAALDESPLYDRRTGLMADAGLLEEQGWTNPDTRRFAERLYNNIGQEGVFVANLKCGSLTPELLGRAASEFGFVRSEILMINYYEIAMSYLNRLSIGEKEITYEDQNRISVALLGSVLYVKHKKLTQQPEEKKENKIMMKIETKHFVNDVNVTALSTEDKIKLISETETQIRQLNSVATKSKLVAAEIAKAEVFLQKVNELFDSNL